MFIDKKIIAIIILSITASLMSLATIFSGSPARADQVNASNRDYQSVTARSATGADDLFILDNRTGFLAVFSYDQTRRGVFPRQFTSLSKLFSTGK